MTAAGDIEVLYVGGVPRSGSTLTDLMLDTLPGHVAIGELFYLWRNGVLHDGLCACGAVFSRCPFWTEVGERAFGGWLPEHAEQVMAWQSLVDRTAAVPALLSPRRPAALSAALEKYSGVLRRLYAAIRDVSGARVIVDSSKRPSLAYVLRTMPDVRLTVAHVVRDPRGVAYSFAKTVELPPGAALGAIMPQTRTRIVARRWVTVNALISALGAAGVPLVRVRYEDLVRQPLAQLRRIAAAEGIADPVDTGALTEAGLQVPSTHVVAGGRIRLADGVLPLTLDDAWRREMPVAARRTVSAITMPSRAWYGYL